ncbi:SDR family NAD(P)-dependent oxidoreductase [Paenibacillus borealis]|uniref:SDR family NAD(P)-dependent oxidoreductase n=1 Tax=Paenibacillus borealis TaxID=160799 RepID=UPI000693B8AD|nr:SDR family NAD(P)-dependent oxidoreductase [Paenibacillus borealis]
MNLIKKYIYRQVAAQKLTKEAAKEMLMELQVHPEKTVIKDRVAIIGIGLRFPDSDSPEEYWSNLCKGNISIKDFPEERLMDIPEGRRRTGNIRVKRGGYLSNIDAFDAGYYNIAPSEAKYMNPLQRVFLESATEAVQDAGYEGKRIRKTRTGVYVGVDHTSKPEYPFGEDKNNPLAITGAWTGILASRVSYVFNLRGPSIVIDTACSSGLVAVHTACKAIQDHECDMAIAGGICLELEPAFEEDALSMVASKDDKVRTFDNNANGTVWGEGVGVVVLKPLRKAVEDKDHIYAVIKGSAVNNDGTSNGITAPDAEAQEEVLMGAWEDAGIHPESLSYIEAHGTGTVLGDPIEVKGLTSAFSRYTDKKQFCGIGSVKTNIGHTVAASGMASLLKVVLSLQKRMIPGTRHFEAPNRYINFPGSPLYMVDKTREWTEEKGPRRAGVSAFGFSGTNCHMVLEEASGPETGSEAGGLEGLMLSAKTTKALLKLLEAYKGYLERNQGVSKEALSYTANTGREHHAYRIAITYEETKELKEKVTGLVQQGLRGNVEEGIFYEAAGDAAKEEKKRLTELAKQLVEEMKHGDRSPKKLKEMCTCYVKGAEVDWEGYYEGQGRRKISLPVYPFEKKRFWLDLVDNGLYHQSSWGRRNLRESDRIASSAITLVLQGNSNMSDFILREVISKRKRVITVCLGTRYSCSSTTSFIVNGSEEDYTRLFKEIGEIDIQQILHLQTLTPGAGEVESLTELQEYNARGLHSLFNLTRALLKSHNTGKILLNVITPYANPVTEAQKYINPHGGALSAMGKVIRLEHPQIQCRIIDIDGITDVQEIWKDIDREHGEYAVAYRDGHRYVEHFRSLHMVGESDQQIEIKNDGVYVITGGTGGIGLELAYYLSKKNRVRIVLINRSSFPEPSEWDSVLGLNRDEQICSKIKKMKQITNSGSRLELHCADVSDLEEMSKALHKIRNKHGRIHGVIHGAGIAGTDEFIIKKAAASFEKEMVAKIQGTWIIDKLTENDCLDFIIFISSVASIAGDAGQSAYSSANRYMDTFAAYRNKKGKRTLSINWPAWREVGMTVQHGTELQTGVFEAISIDEAITAFDVLLHQSLSNVVVGRVDRSKKGWTDRLGVGNESDHGSHGSEVIVQSVPPKECNGTEAKIWKIWSEVLESDLIGLDDDFIEVGGNSILSMNIEVKMQQHSGVKIKELDLEIYNTIRKLAAYIDGNEFIATPEKGTLVQREVLLHQWFPFNNVFYKYCFYNSLFSIVFHARGNIFPYLANDFMLYTYGKTESLADFFVSYHSSHSVRQLAALMEIDVYAESHFSNKQAEFNISESDIVMLNNYYEDIGTGISNMRPVSKLLGALEDAMRNKRPVIIWIDCFYDSNRKDTYKKHHWPHALLILENDSENRRFLIIDHDKRGSLNYKKRYTRYEDVFQAYEGFLANYKIHTKLPTYFEFHYELKELGDYESELNLSQVTYAKNILKVSEKIYTGLSDLNRFLIKIEEIVSIESQFRIHAQELIEKLNGVSDGKSMEAFRSRILWGASSPLTVQADHILAKWGQMKSIITKYYFSGKYDPEKIENVKYLLRDIQKREEEYYILVLSEMEDILK